MDTLNSGTHYISLLGHHIWH